jgi:hypothetical protein
VRRAPVALAAAALLAATTAAAHGLKPARLDLVEQGGLVVARVVSSAGAPSIRPVLPAWCRAVSPWRVDARGAERVAEARFRCAAPGLGGATLGVTGLTVTGSDLVVRWVPARGAPVTLALREGHTEARLPARPADALAAFASYIPLGFEHILAGWDHLAFVLGLLLLVRRRADGGLLRRVLGTVSAFTLGHSVTLALAALGAVSLRPAPVECLIALSIALMAREAARPADAPSTWSERWPWAVALGFGLLHGLGFAGALAEVGLPDGEIPAALAAFNVGVEAGQAVFVVAALGALALLRRLGARATALTLAGARYAMGGAAMYWTLDRIWRIA